MEKCFNKVGHLWPGDDGMKKLILIHLLLIYSCFQYYGMDEFLEKDIKLRTAQKNRGALMNLLLNSTLNHELMKEKLKEQEEQARVNEDDDEEEDSSSSSSS